MLVFTTTLFSHSNSAHICLQELGFHGSRDVWYIAFLKSANKSGTYDNGITFRTRTLGGFTVLDELFSYN